MQTMAKAYTGAIKSFNPEKGWGHIECPETFALYGKDIFLLRSQLNEVTPNKGVQVSFTITDNGRGPEASNIRMVGGRQGQGPGAAGTYIGTVKSFNPQSGWGHITCSQTEQMFGKDMFFMKSQTPNGSVPKGATVQFSVAQGQKGPEAIRLLVLGNGYSSGPPQQQQWGGPPPMYALPQQQHQQQPQPWGGGKGYGAPPAPLGAPTGQVFYGTVKSFNEEKGWGHITCPQTQAIYGKDMFLLRSALGGDSVNANDQVQFSVNIGMKGPEAASVKVIGRGAATQSFVGTIKQYDQEKGWGFIVCDETRQLYDKDIFMHRNELSGYVPQVGEIVQFTVQISPQGRPEATTVVMNPGSESGAMGPAMGGPIVEGSPYAALRKPFMHGGPGAPATG